MVARPAGVTRASLAHGGMSLRDLVMARLSAHRAPVLQARYQRLARRIPAPLTIALAQQPALSAIEPDLAVLGRQHRAGALCRGPRAAADSVLHPMDRLVHPAMAICQPPSQEGLACAARAMATAAGAGGHRLCHQQCVVLLGTAI